MSPFRFGQQSVVTSSAPTDFGRFYSNVCINNMETQLMGLLSIVMSRIGPMNGVFEMNITSDLTGWMNMELNLDQVSKTF